MLDRRRKWVLAVFAGVFVVMIYAVIPFDEIGAPIPTLSWWFPELSGLLLAGGNLDSRKNTSINFHTNRIHRS